VNHKIILNKLEKCGIRGLRYIINFNWKLSVA